MKRCAVCYNVVASRNHNHNLALAVVEYILFFAAIEIANINKSICEHLISLKGLRVEQLKSSREAVA